jgi:hypothetical protein
MTADIAPLDAVPAAEPDSGLGALATSRGNLPLDAVDVRAAISGMSASVDLTQGFRNPFDVPLEATYIFPLPARAAVTAMRMECADHVVAGMLKERAQAREDYDQAVAEGKRAAIAEEDRPDVFTMRVGNIAPGERVTVRLTLSQPLPYEDGDVTFRFPLVVAPRYIPGSPLDGSPAGSGVAADTDAVPDASRITPPAVPRHRAPGQDRRTRRHGDARTARNRDPTARRRAGRPGTRPRPAAGHRRPSRERRPDPSPDRPSLTGIRVHVVGIDRAVNAGFLGRLASAGHGRCELVESEDRLDEAAVRIHQRIGAPLVTGLALTADGLRILQETVAPSLLPDIFPGVPVTITGRWQGHAGGTVTVRGTASDGAPFEAAVGAVTGGTPAVAANWARAHLRDLEDRYATLAGHDTAALARLEHEITSVSLRYGVLCRFTAFVAVDSAVVTDGKAPHRVTQPVELPSGWGQPAPSLPPPRWRSPVAWRLRQQRQGRDRRKPDSYPAADRRQRQAAPSGGRPPRAGRDVTAASPPATRPR